MKEAIVKERIQEERTRSRANNRNTKRWCRGKVGVEHDLETRLLSGVKRILVGCEPRGGALADVFKGWLVRYCKACGKEIAQYHPPFLPRTNLPRRYDPKPIPAWAAEWYEAHPESRPTSIAASVLTGPGKSPATRP